MAREYLFDSSDSPISPIKLHLPRNSSDRECVRAMLGVHRARVDRDRTPSSRMLPSVIGGPGGEGVTLARERLGTFSHDKLFLANLVPHPSRYIRGREQEAAPVWGS
jgi:hypothetical protein